MKLTLTQAQERLARFDGLGIDWTRPAEEACRIALAANDFRLRRADIEFIHESLSGYASHLSFREGKAPEAAATRRLIDQEIAYFERGEIEAHGQDTRLACGAKASALRSLASLIDEGLHYAEPEKRQVLNPKEEQGQ